LHVAGLPAGLSAKISGSTIAVTGTPAQSGTFSNIAVSLVDSDGDTGSGTETLTVASAVTLGDLVPDEWTVNEPGYDGTIDVSGGSGGYHNLQVTGLPQGLNYTLNTTSVVIGGQTQQSGFISVTGTPTQSGDFTVLVSLQDGTGAWATRQSAGIAAVLSFAEPASKAEPKNKTNSYPLEIKAAQSLVVHSRIPSGVTSLSGVGFRNLGIADLDLVQDDQGNLDTNPSDYRVSIDWGDSGQNVNQSRTAQVALVSEGQPGSTGAHLVVEGTHVYYSGYPNQQQNFNVSITVTYSGSVKLAAPVETTKLGSIGVNWIQFSFADTPSVTRYRLGTQPKTAFNGSEPEGDVDFTPHDNELSSVVYQPLQNQTVGWIGGSYNGNPDNDTSQYHVMINWGDDNWRPSTSARKIL
jgi:hypothetical protein